jgi:hypothetical protein
MRQKYADFPNTAHIDRQAVNECMGPLQPHAKRNNLNTYHSNDTAPKEEHYEDGEVLERRTFVDRVQAAGKELFLRERPFCTAPEVPKDFMWIEDIVQTSVDLCDRLKSEIVLNELDKDGGTGWIIDTLLSGHAKQGHQLKDKTKTLVYYGLKFLPPAKMAVDQSKAIAQGIFDLCNDGIERILTKGTGCTQEITYFRPSKGKTFTDSAARSGSVDLFWGDSKTLVGNLVVDFLG